MTLRRRSGSVSYLPTGRWMHSLDFTACLKVPHHSLTMFLHYKTLVMPSALEGPVSQSATRFSRTIFYFFVIRFSVSAYVQSLHSAMQILALTPSLVLCHRPGIPWSQNVSSALHYQQRQPISQNQLPLRKCLFL